MSWRDLKQPPDDWYEMQRPEISTSARLDGQPVVVAVFTDDISHQWFAEWLRSRHGWEAFRAWTAERL
jgi:hypothetical protein